MHTNGKWDLIRCSKELDAENSFAYSQYVSGISLFQPAL